MLVWSMRPASLWWLLVPVFFIVAIVAVLLAARRTDGCTEEVPVTVGSYFAMAAHKALIEKLHEMDKIPSDKDAWDYLVLLVWDPKDRRVEAWTYLSEAGLIVEAEVLCVEGGLAGEKVLVFGSIEFREAVQLPDGTVQ